MTTTIRPHDVHDPAADLGVVIDVRSPAEFVTARIPGSHNIPLEHVGSLAAALRDHSDLPLVVTCQTGRRATEAQQRLAGAGLEDVRVLEGGLMEWQRAGNDVIRGRQRWAIERQVRLVAGSLVVLGVLSSRRHVAGAFLAGGVGAGLAVAALTDSCLMGTLLGRLPYNKPGSFDLESAIADVRA
jgi:rhodanese-related sulfurtransferase